MRFILLALIISGCSVNLGIFVVDKATGSRHRVASCKIDSKNQYLITQEINNINEFNIKKYDSDLYFCEIWDYSAKY